MNKYETVAEIVYKYFEREPSDIFIHSRKMFYTEPRHITWYFLKTTFRISEWQQSKHFKFNHANILYGINRIIGWYETDKCYREKIDRISNEIKTVFDIELPKAIFQIEKEMVISIYLCENCKGIIHAKDFKYCPNCGIRINKNK